MKMANLLFEIFDVLGYVKIMELIGKYHVRYNDDYEKQFRCWIFADKSKIYEHCGEFYLKQAEIPKVKK